MVIPLAHCIPSGLYVNTATAAECCASASASLSVAVCHASTTRCASLGRTLQRARDPPGGLGGQHDADHRLPFQRVRPSTSLSTCACWSPTQTACGAPAARPATRHAAPTGSGMPGTSKKAIVRGISPRRSCSAAAPRRASGSRRRRRAYGPADYRHDRTGVPPPSRSSQR
jgi:hypothetical protein